MQDDVNTIKEVVFTLREQINQAPFQAADDKPMSLGEAAEFLDIAEQTIYQNIKKVPHRKRFGRLYFFKTELLTYLDGKEVNRD
ncbi:helix-turn-helix domain-containing protein [Spirosoma areae]